MKNFDDESVIDDLLHFWFGSSDIPDSATQARWFVRDPSFDDLVRRTWGPVIEAAERHELQWWDSTPRGALAHVVALDQFPRNVFRDTPRAFAFDALARQTAAAAVDAGHDSAVPLFRRPFFYLPFMHSEALADQDRCVALYAQLLAQSPAEFRAAFERNLDYAQRHHEIVRRFGRFPHRNAILGRETTADEAEFLRQPGSSF